MAAMAASQTWWSPTVQVLRTSALAGKREFRSDPRRRYIPYVVWAGLWQPDADRAVAQTRHASGRDVDAELYQLPLDNVRQAHAAGVRIVAGTDRARWPICSCWMPIHPSTSVTRKELQAYSSTSLEEDEHVDSTDVPIPLSDDERTALRPGVDADALAQLCLLIDPKTRRLILGLVQRRPPPPSELAESLRDIVGQGAADEGTVHGPKAVWIDFPDPVWNRLWHRVIGL